MADLRSGRVLPLILPRIGALVCAAGCDHRTSLPRTHEGTKNRRTITLDFVFSCLRGELFGEPRVRLPRQPGSCTAGALQSRHDAATSWLCPLAPDSASTKSSRSSAAAAWARFIARATRRLARDVALKVLPADKDARCRMAAHAFEREARALAALSHPQYRRALRARRTAPRLTPETSAITDRHGAGGRRDARDRN